MKASYDKPHQFHEKQAEVWDYQHTLLTKYDWYPHMRSCQQVPLNLSWQMLFTLMGLGSHQFCSKIFCYHVLRTLGYVWYSDTLLSFTACLKIIRILSDICQILSCYYQYCHVLSCHYQSTIMLLSDYYQILFGYDQAAWMYCQFIKHAKNWNFQKPNQTQTNFAKERVC